MLLGKKSSSLFRFFSEISDKNLTALLITLGLVHGSLLWPGILTPDSESQYAQALSGIFNNHHPPLMSFLWRYLDKLYPGPGLLLICHLSLLYGAVYYLIQSLSPFRGKILFLFVPWIPQVLVFSGMIWKDVGFAFSFLWVGSLLAYLTLKKIPPLKRHVFFILLILFYGTSIKFQAKYCAPIFLAWLAYCLLNYRFRNKTFFPVCLLIFIPFYTLLGSVDRLLVPETQQTHSWQYVKIYDLAAISVALNTPLFPSFVKSDHFSLEALKKSFNTQRVDDLAFGPDPVLRIGRSEAERTVLWDYWFKTITEHPIYYLKHRFSILSYGLICIPAQSEVTKLLETTAPHQLLYELLKTTCFVLLSHALTVILATLYCLLAWVTRRMTPAAIPLFCFNSTGLMMVLVLLFFSMAGSPRYTYITVCMTHASHLFAYIAISAWLTSARSRWALKWLHKI